ncbi:response regulator [Vibrio sp. RE86]|uniref:hybrid sensor histidine kinase/response regulator n=1 Tax=Vibrio sp. RE86 TaxID=2607605 RepID=UPI0014933B17|nr:ATP-binding protein [Vibrio sp. RE86]NOH81000.1 response regulator [Vibrio sp. RE86]
MSFKNRIITANALIVVLFAAFLAYAAMNIVQRTSIGQFNEIKENIMGHNRDLLLTFVKAQSVSLNKEIELIVEDIEHMSGDFAHDYVQADKTTQLRDAELAHINRNLKTFINEVTFIDTKTRQEIRIHDGQVEQSDHKASVSDFGRYKSMFIEKKTSGNVVTHFNVYVFPEHWPSGMLKFDVNLDYFSNSLAFKSMIEKLQYRYFLVDEDGNLVASNLKQDPLTLLRYMTDSSSNSKSVAAQITSNNFGSMVVNAIHGIFNITFVRNEVTGWRLILVTPESVVRSSYATTKQALLLSDSLLIEKFTLATGMLLLLFLAINAMVVKRLIAPIGILTAQAKALKQGDFARATITLKGNGEEIEQLSKAYSEAGVQISTLISGLEEDVTLRTAQYELAAKQASDANAEKSTLLSNVSHEIRTPLNAIIGYTHMLSKEVNLMQFNHQLNGISSASNTILGIVNDLLDFERLQASSYTLNPKEVEFKEVLGAIEHTFFPLAQGKGLTLNMDNCVEQGFVLYVDELRLKQCISNVVSNAIKFTGEGKVTVCCYLKQEQLHIDVIDTGVGIPPEKLDKVFNDFEQVNDEDQQFGFGLGLAITKTIIELMGGTIKVSSEVGSGSTFSLRLPLSKASFKPLGEVSVPLLELSSPVSQLYSGVKALVVDDVEFNREILAYHLSELGFDCLFAEDGLQALKVVSEQEVDVVLTDISMPVMDGIGLAKELASCNPLLPIVAVTARATLTEQADMNSYFDSYLTKPIAEQDLKDCLQMAFMNKK